jgi:hypothetical protein
VDPGTGKLFVYSDGVFGRTRRGMTFTPDADLVPAPLPASPP